MLPTSWDEQDEPEYSGQRSVLLAGIDALRAPPDFHLVTSFGQDLAPPNGGMVTEVLTAMYRENLVSLDDADLVIVHDASPNRGMGIARAYDKDVGRF
jgi:hypothetical protein